MRILGVDPGLIATGYSVLEGKADAVSVLEAGVVRIETGQPLEMRLFELGAELEAILKQFDPDGVAVEELYSHYGHPRTAIIMGHARGVIFLKAAEAGKPVYHYSATRIKKSLTGNGRASKRQVQLMVQSTLRLPTVPEPPDTADAIAAALCHIRAFAQEKMVAQ